MTKADVKIIKRAIEQAFKYGTSDTYSFKNNTQFFVSYDDDLFCIKICSEYKPFIKFNSIEALLQFLS